MKQKTNNSKSGFREALIRSYQDDRIFPYSKDGVDEGGNIIYKYLDGFPKDICWLISLMNLAKKECRFAMARFYEENLNDFRYAKVYHENRVIKLCGKRVYLLDVFSDYFKFEKEDNPKRAIEIIKTLSVVKGNKEESLTPYLLGVLTKKSVQHRINMWIYTEGYIIFDDSSHFQREVIKYTDLENYINSKYEKIISITAVMEIDTDEQASCHENGTLK